MREPLAGVGVCVVLGAAAWPWLRASAGAGLVAALALLLVAALGRRQRAAWLALLAAGACLGLAAAALSPRPTGPPPQGAVVGRVRQVMGQRVVLATPGGDLRLWSDQAVAVGQPLAALVRAEPPAPLLPGDPGAPPDDLRAGQRPVRAAQVLPLTGAPRGPDPFADARNAGLLRALALGDRSGVDEDTRALLRQTGTSHLLAISGLHVGLLAGAVGGLAWLASRPLALTRAWPVARALPALASAAAAVAYALAVGAPASARRAAVMVGVAAGAVLLGRRPRAWSLLGLAALVLTLTRPGVVGDVGFQLSASAVAGMLLVGPRVTRWLPPDQPAPVRFVARSLAATLGATAGTLPIVALCFQEVAPVSPVANLLAAPLVGSLVVPAAIAGVALPAPLGPAAVRLADGGLDLALWALRLLRGAPWTPAVGAAGALGLALALLLRRHAATAALLAALALGLRAVPRDRLVLTFLAVGQGDATLVEWPDGRRWLVDGGPGGPGLVRYLRRRGIRHLDALVLSHDHPDHSAGLLAVADALPFDALWLPRPPPAPHGDAWALWQRAWRRGATVHLPDDPPPGGALVEHPIQGWRATGRDAVNEESLVLLLRHGRHSALLTGDIEEDAERTLARTLLPATIVKVPHHGSKTSSSADFVQATRPAVAVFPVGRGNRYGHPHRQALGAWRRPGAGLPACAAAASSGRGCRTRLLRTDLDGTVQWSTDGRTWRLRTWRPDTGWRARTPPP